MTALTLLVVDDHPVVRDGIVGMVGSAEDIDVIGEASDGVEAVALARVHAPDVVLMDLRMPRMDGVAALREFARLGITSRVVVLTTFDADADVLPAIAAGATGYLLKDATRDELLDAIRAAAAGRTVLASEVASRLVGRVRAPEASLLTPARAGDPRPGRRGHHEPRRRRPAAPQRSHRQDAPAEHLRQARRRRPCRCRGRGLPPRPARHGPLRAARADGKLGRWAMGSSAYREHALSRTPSPTRSLAAT